MVFKARDVRRNLKKKGFVEEDDGHHIYLHFYYDGKVAGPYTFTSHGADSDDLGDKIVRDMKKQLRLETNQQVHQLVDCTLSEAKYIALLKKNKVVS